MSRQPLEIVDPLNSDCGVEVTQQAATGQFCGRNCNQLLTWRLARRTLAVLACCLLVAAATLLPHRRALMADTRTSLDAVGWEIELVPRSAGPQSSGRNPERQDRPDRHQRPAETAAVSEGSAELTADTEQLTPADKGWERVDTEPSFSERAVPLNAVRVTERRKLATPTTADHIARPLNAVASRSTPPAGPVSSERNVVRSVSSSRPNFENRSEKAAADAPVARLKMPNFAQREQSAAAPQTQSAEHARQLPVESPPATAFKPSAGALPPRGQPTFPMARGRNDRVVAEHTRNSRPMAGALPQAVRADETAEPLMANDSRSTAMAAVSRRTARRSAAVVTPESSPDRSTFEKNVASNSMGKVVAPDPERSLEERRDRPESASGPLAGHSLFVDPFPLVPTFTGGSPAYSLPGRRSAGHHESPYGRRLPASGYYLTPNVVPQRSIPHTGWYGPSTDVRSISHSESAPPVVSGHSVFGR